MGESIKLTTARAERQQMRRNQILDAASKCFLAHGFHGASMALVAASAEMSVGQIYRFFASKEAIISAIVARQLGHMVERLPKPGALPSEARAALSTEAKLTAADFFNPKRAGLIVEIRAEASRNPAVAEVVRTANATIGAHFRALISAASPELDDPIELDRRAGFLAIVIDGLIFRSSIDHQMDRTVVTELIDLVCNAATVAN